MSGSQTTRMCALRGRISCSRFRWPASHPWDGGCMSSRCVAMRLRIESRGLLVALPLLESAVFMSVAAGGLLGQSMMCELQGSAGGSCFGQVVLSAGDLDGDGLEDVL